MTAYTTENRAQHMLRIHEDKMAEVKEYAEALDITTSAALAMIFDLGLEVHRLLQAERPMAAAVVAGVAGRKR